MLLHLETKERVTKFAFIGANFGRINPLDITDEVLLPFGFALLNNTDEPKSTNLQKYIDDGVEQLEDGTYSVKWKLVDKTEEEIQEEFIARQKRYVDDIQSSLDDFAKTRKYDSMLSACTYATSTDEVFKREGQRCVDLRDQTWKKLYEIFGEVQAGTKDRFISLGEVVAMLPQLTWEETPIQPTEGTV